MIRKRLVRVALQVSAATAISLATLPIQNRTDEIGVYGNMGTLWENVRPRVIGGWPAPFLADSSATSVPNQLGPEDEFRPGPFVATLAFWYLAIGWSRRLVAYPASLRSRTKD